MKHNRKNNQLGNLNRRQLLLGLGSVAVAVVVPVSVQADFKSRARSDEPFIEKREDGDFLIVASSVGLGGHWHNLEIPMNFFSDPDNAELEYKTTKAGFHRHAVHLTIADLIEIQRGGRLTVEDSNWGEHSFEIYLPQQERSFNEL